MIIQTQHKEGAVNLLHCSAVLFFSHQLLAQSCPAITVDSGEIAEGM